MTAVVALLRSVNVGGNRMKMDLLREVAAAAGCRDVSTVLATGNVVMSPDDTRTLEQVGTALEGEPAVRYGELAVIMRTHEELADAVTRNPWSQEVADGRHEGRFPHTMFLRAVPDPETVAALHRDESDDDFVVDGRDVFIRYAGMSHSSRYNTGWLQRHLGVVGTARNHNTVQRLVEVSASTDLG